MTGGAGSANITMIIEMSKQAAPARTPPPDPAAAFKALGDPTRLRIFEFLCRCSGPVAIRESGEVSRMEGPTAGQVCCTVTGAQRITSTISHHLKELRQAGLITVTRHGKHRVFGVNPAASAFLAGYFRQIEPPKS